MNFFMKKQMKRRPKECICPNCGYKEVHKLRERCSTKICPKCGSRMIGKW